MYTNAVKSNRSPIETIRNHTSIFISTFFPSIQKSPRVCNCNTHKSWFQTNLSKTFRSGYIYLDRVRAKILTRRGATISDRICTDYLHDSGPYGTRKVKGSKKVAIICNRSALKFINFLYNFRFLVKLT